MRYDDTYQDGKLIQRVVVDETAKTITAYSAQDGKLTETASRAMTAEEVQTLTVQTNTQTIEDLMRSALAANKKFLALEKPLTADVVAQVRLLTREVSGLIRRELSEFGEVE